MEQFRNNGLTLLTYELSVVYTVNQNQKLLFYRVSSVACKNKETNEPMDKNIYFNYGGLAKIF
jgi:hypothetical protein